MDMRSGCTGDVSMRNGIVDPLILEDIIHRIVSSASPEKIILFGSGAQGEMRPDSDIDLLVIKNGEFDAGALTEEIYMQLIGVGQAVDVVVVSATDAKRYRDSPYFIVYPALQQGREVYNAGQVST
jgi:predicted nucleotidyltransferase